MKSGGARGVLAGWIVFLALTAVAALTPARLPVLRFAGLEAAVIRLEARAAVTAEERDAVERHRTEWRRLHGHLSPFGLMAFAQDVWPWLLGLGVALPLLGGLIGAQTGARGSTAARAPRAPSSSSAPSAAPVPPREDEPAVAHPELAAPAPRAVADRFPSIPESPPESRPEEPPPPPAPPVRPPDPAAWDWKVRPAVRPSARPKPPAVESPNARDGSGE